MAKQKTNLRETERSVLEQGINCNKTKCKFCCRSFVDKRNYAIHLKRNHEVPFKCNYCTYTTRIKSNYAKHLKRSHEVPFKCNYCTYTTRVKISFTNHMVSHGITKNVYKCRFCDNEYKHFCNRHNHEISHIGLLCKYCQKKFRSTYSLQSHIGRSHPEQNKLICDQCGKSFPNMVMRNAHFRNTLCGKNKNRPRSTNPKVEITNSFLYFCNCCGQGFSKEQSLMEHKVLQKCESPQVQQDDIKFSFSKHFNTNCVLCHQSIIDMNHLRDHLKSEHKELYNPETSNPKNCKLCGKFLKNSSVFFFHMLKHLGFKPFKCHICSYRTNWNSSMKVHLLSHGKDHHDYSYTCHICNITYFKTHVYTRHMKIEHNFPEFKFFCEKCGNGYYSSSSFNFHKKKCGSSITFKEESIKDKSVTDLGNQIKSNDKNFICIDCGFEYDSSVLLQQHKVLFSFDRLCDLCGYLATHGSFLSCHLKKEHPSNCLQCDICRLKMTNPATYNKHLNSHCSNRNKNLYMPTPDSEEEDLFCLDHLQKYKNTSTVNFLKDSLFECSICGKGFSNAHELLDHERSHKIFFSKKSYDKYLFRHNFSANKKCYKNRMVKQGNTIQPPIEFTINESKISIKVESGSVILSHPEETKNKLYSSRPSYIFDDFLMSNDNSGQDVLVSNPKECSEKDKLASIKEHKLLILTNNSLQPEIKIEPIEEESFCEKLQISKLHKQLNNVPMVFIKLSHFPKSSRLHKRKQLKPLHPTVSLPLTSKLRSNRKLEKKIGFSFAKNNIKNESDLSNCKENDLESSKSSKILSSQFTVIDPLSKLPLSNHIFKNMKPLNLNNMSLTSVRRLKLVGTIHANNIQFNPNMVKN